MNAKTPKYATLTTKTTAANATIKEEVVPVLIHGPSSDDEPQYAFDTFATTEEAEASLDPQGQHQRRMHQEVVDTQEVIIDEHGRPIAIHQVLTDDGNSVEEVEVVEESDNRFTILHIAPTGWADVGHDESLGSTEEYEATNAVLGDMNSRNDKIYCPNCGNCYSAAGSFKVHMRACMRQKAEVPKEKRKCPICNRVFSSVSYLKEHMLRYTGEGTKRCSRCYRKFINEEKFNAHMEQHKHQDKLEMLAASITAEHGFKKMVVEEYTCSFCSDKFTVVFEAGAVKRRYACDPCRDKYSNAETLKQHKQMVDEKREFSCDRCGRKFVFEGFLQRHIPTCDGTNKRKRDMK